MFFGPSNGLSTFTSQRNYILLFVIIYEVSNNLADDSPHPELLRNLNSVFAAVPAKYLEDLLHSRLDSIRAAFEALLDFSAKYDQRDAFKSLVKIGATYGWLAVAAKGHTFLSYAASTGLIHALQTLLNNGCRPDFWISFSDSNLIRPNAIAKALACGQRKCAELLLERCDVNKKVWTESPMTQVEYFLYELDAIGELSEEGLALFLQAGADLGEPLAWFETFSSRWDWSFSIVDYLFYFHRPLFHNLPSGSIGVRNGLLSRAGVLQSLESGIQGLKNYLASLTPRVDQQRPAEFFQLLIAEQFAICDLHRRKRNTDLEIVRALLSVGAHFGVSIEQILLHVPYILHLFVGMVGDHLDGSQVEAALYLVENGATVTGRVLSWMARLPDQRPFDLALGRIKSPRGLDIAVAHAATRNNFEAIERLIRAGAQLDTDFRSSKRDLQGRVSIVARVISNHEQT